MQVVGQSCDGHNIVELAQQTAAHLVCMDIGLPGMNGIELTRLLLRALPHLKVVALSAYSDKLHVLDMINAGAKGYVTKVEDGDELLRASVRCSSWWHRVTLPIRWPASYCSPPPPWMCIAATSCASSTATVWPS